MIKEILKSYEDVAIASMETSKLKGDLERLSELSGYLIEKSKSYREERDIKGAEAIELIVLDDIKHEFDSVYGQFQEAMENWKQKYKKFENVCKYYGIPVASLKSEKVINFYK